MGGQAAYVASRVSKQLHAIGMKCTIHKCTQPAQLSHITYNQHLIGCDDNYTALTPSAMELLTEMVVNYRRVQGRPEHISITRMPQAIDSLISSGMNHLSERANKLATLPIDVPSDDNNENEWRKTTCELAKRVNQQGMLIQELIDIISTNAFVSATIQDRMIGSTDATSSLQTGVAARPASVGTRGSTLPVSVPKTDTGDDQSSMSSSVVDFLTPITRRKSDSVSHLDKSNTSDVPGDGRASKTSSKKAQSDDWTDSESKDLMDIFNNMPAFTG